MSIIDKRKRSREDDVSCDSTPLSKRINNLHLSNFEEAHNNNDISQHLSKEMLIHHHNQHASSSTSVSSEEADKNMYDPELNALENPFYYQNKLLHELHMERLKRTGTTSHLHIPNSIG